MNTILKLALIAAIGILAALGLLWTLTQHGEWVYIVDMLLGWVAGFLVVIIIRAPGITYIDESITYVEAKKLITNYMAHRDTVYYDELMDKLHINIDMCIRVCDNLVREGIIRIEEG